MRYLKFIITFLLGILVGWMIWARPANAKVAKIWICHKPGTPTQKSLFIPVTAWPGHKGHGDHKGKCREVKPTPTPTPKPRCEWGEWSECRVEVCGHGTQVRVKEGSCCKPPTREIRRCFVECEPTPTPTVTPTPTEKPKPTPTEAPKKGPPGAEPCIGEPVTVAPIYDWDSCKRTDPDTVVCNWEKNDPHAMRYGIHFGMSEDNLPWFIEVEGHETTSVVLDHIPPGHMWAKICSIGNCGDKVCGEAVDP